MRVKIKRTVVKVKGEFFDSEPKEFSFFGFMDLRKCIKKEPELQDYTDYKVSYLDEEYELTEEQIIRHGTLITKG